MNLYNLQLEYHKMLYKLGKRLLQFRKYQIEYEQQ